MLWLEVPALGPSRAGSCSAPPQNANDASGSSTHDPDGHRRPPSRPPSTASFHRRLTR